MLLRRQRYFILAFNLFTILLWAWVLIEFFSRSATLVSATVANTYLLILAFYASDKEIRRWRRDHRSTQRRGERFVFGWVLTLLATVAVEILGGAEHGYRVPRQLPLIAVSVAAIYVITEYLKLEFKKR